MGNTDGVSGHVSLEDQGSKAERLACQSLEGNGRPLGLAPARPSVIESGRVHSPARHSWEVESHGRVPTGALGTGVPLSVPTGTLGAGIPCQGSQSPVGAGVTHQLTSIEFREFRSQETLPPLLLLAEHPEMQAPDNL